MKGGVELGEGGRCRDRTYDLSRVKRTLSREQAQRLRPWWNRLLGPEPAAAQLRPALVAHQGRRQRVAFLAFRPRNVVALSRCIAP
jgi:hypothetical protein